MKLFFHHVGQQGARVDFPKTVYSPVSIDVVKANIPSSNPIRQEVLGRLNDVFAGGSFNCWGVPAGAANVIRNLKVGDAVLLIETTSGPGSIPVLGVVKAYWNSELRALSDALWGNQKFPYVFFFDTERIDFTWLEFVDHMGYRGNYRPSGQFLSVSEERLAQYGGTSAYIERLLSSHGVQHDADGFTYRKQFIGDDNPLQQIKDYKATYNALDRTQREAVIQSRIGQGMFRDNLIRYWGECAVTGCKNVRILRASHIRPWKDSNNEERLDTFNGLLLIPNLDVAFDKGIISFNANGQIMVLSSVHEADREILGIDSDMMLSRFEEKHEEYLQYHRKNVFGK